METDFWKKIDTISAVRNTISDQVIMVFLVKNENIQIVKNNYIFSV